MYFRWYPVVVSIILLYIVFSYFLCPSSSMNLGPGLNFIELLSTTICLAWNFFLDKNRITNQISICCILLVTGIQLLFAYPENHVEIWLVILFLSRKKFHAKQIFVLSSAMNLGPGLIFDDSSKVSLREYFSRHPPSNTQCDVSSDIFFAAKLYRYNALCRMKIALGSWDKRAGLDFTKSQN